MDLLLKKVSNPTILDKPLFPFKPFLVILELNFVTLMWYRNSDVDCWHEGWSRRATCSKSKGNMHNDDILCAVTKSDFFPSVCSNMKMWCWWITYTEKNKTKQNYTMQCGSHGVVEYLLKMWCINFNFLPANMAFIRIPVQNYMLWLGLLKEHAMFLSGACELGESGCRMVFLFLLFIFWFCPSAYLHCGKNKETVVITS